MHEAHPRRSLAVIYGTNDIRQIKKNDEAYFEAQTVKVSPIKLALVTMFSAEVATSDHPGTPATATFETIAAFLKKYDEGSEIITVLPE